MRERSEGRQRKISTWFALQMTIVFNIRECFVIKAYTESGEKVWMWVLTGMDNVHGAHGTAGIVEDILLVQVDMVRMHTRQLLGNVVYYCLRVIAMGCDTALRQVMQVVLVKDIEGLEILLNQVYDGREYTNQDGNPR